MDPAVDRVVAVRGTGSIGMRHLRILRDRLGAHVVAVPVRPERAAELERCGYAVARRVDDLARYEAVCSIVATDTGRHVDDAAELIAFGDVLVEKPLASSPTHLFRLSQLVDTARHRIACAYYLRHHPGLQIFRRRLPDVGRVHSVRIACQSYLPEWRIERDYRASYSARAAEGGVLRDLSHELDYAVWLFGRPRSVLCTAGTSGQLDIESEDHADVTWETPEHVQVSIRLDYLTRTPQRLMMAYGSGGVLSWNALAGMVTFQPTGGVTEMILAAADRDDVYVAQAIAFLESQRDLDTLTTFDEAAFLVSLIDAAYTSARSHRPETVAEWTCS